MNQNTYLVLNEKNFSRYSDRLIFLYLEKIGAPVEDDLSNFYEVKEQFKNWISLKDAKIILAVEDDDMIGFATGIKASCDTKFEELEAKELLKETYFISELVMFEDAFSAEKASALIEEVVFLNSSSYSKFLLGIRKEYSDSLTFVKEHFQLTQAKSPFSSPDQQRMNYQVSDLLDFYYFDQRVKTIPYKSLFSIKTKECDMELVDAQKYDSSISRIIDNRVAVRENVEGEKALLRDEVAKKLASVNQKLKARFPNLSLNLVSGLRSVEFQNSLFQTQKDILSAERKEFETLYDFIEEIHQVVSVPTVSGNVTGGALAVTIIDDETQAPLNMGTRVYEKFSENIYRNSIGLDSDIQRNRQLLLNLMTSEGFAPGCEWWHFSYGDKEWAAFNNDPKAIFDVIK